MEATSLTDARTASRPSTGVPAIPDAADLRHITDVSTRMYDAVREVIEGKDEVVATAVTVFLAGGHLLLEDVPGVGKTMLAKALAAAVDSPMRRIQFTPDLLPSDITGISVFNQATGHFDFRPGAIFANIVVCDEINRASPKTQSAVLESMEEGQVTVDGETHVLAQPFLVIATQNPLEMEGTFPLPEAQRDRFMARVTMGYPSAGAEAAMLDVHGARNALAGVAAVTDGETVASVSRAVTGIHASDLLKHYIVALVSATRQTPALRLGASPRASLHLLRAARARAAMHGRDHVLPDDVQALAVPVLAHRLLPSPESQLARRPVVDILTELVRTVPIPTSIPTPGSRR